MATTTNFAAGDGWPGAGAFAGMTTGERTRTFARARRHTRLVRLLRYSLPASAIGIVALYVVMVLDTSGWGVGLPRIDMPSIIPDNLTMDNPTYQGFNKDGGSYIVKAKTAVQDLVNTDFVKLNEITGDLTDAKKSKTNLKAARGEFNTKTNQLELTGGIDIVADSGMRAKLASATILTKENVIFSKEPVVVEMPSGTITSNELKVHNKSRELAFIDAVKAHLVPPKKPATAEGAAPETAQKKAAAPLIGTGSGPIDITASRLDIDDTGKKATFSGSVKAVQAGAALETAALEVRYAGGDAASAAATPGASAKIERIVSKTPVVMTRAPADRVTSESFDYDAMNEVARLDGDVVMTSGSDRRATGETATLDQRADTVLLTGDVLVVQGRNQLKGRRLFVDRSTGRTQLTSPTAEGEPGGRIQSRFYRSDDGKGGPAKVKKKPDPAAAAKAVLPAGGMFTTDPTAPIDIDAARLDLDDRNRQAVFRGDVRAVQGDFVVRTAEMRAFYSGSAGLADQSSTDKKTPAEITKIEARGKVSVTSAEGQTAEGDWADFNVKDNKVILGGDVIITREKNVVRGTKLTIDMVTGMSLLQTEPGAAWSATATTGETSGPGYKMRPGTSTRPSAIFYPRQKKDAEKKPSGDAKSKADPEPANGGGWGPVRGEP